MSSIYEQDIFAPLETDLEAYTNKYTMSPELWGKFYIHDLPGVDFTNWKSLKLIEGGDFSPEVSKITNKYGGIYIYSIEPHILPEGGCYVMYIGKATKTASENLRNRVKAYRKQMGNNFDRDRLHRLFKKWGDYVYIHYLPVDAKPEIITALEDRLIAAYGKPPCNADIRVPSVKAGVRAFN